MWKKPPICTQPPVNYGYISISEREIKQLLMPSLQHQFVLFQNSERRGRVKAMAGRHANSCSRNGRQRRTTQHILTGWSLFEICNISNLYHAFDCVRRGIVTRKIRPNVKSCALNLFGLSKSYLVSDGFRKWLSICTGQRGLRLTWAFLKV